MVDKVQMWVIIYVSVPLLFLAAVIMFVFWQKWQKTISGLKVQLSESTANIARQHTVIELLKSNRCGKHMFDIDDKVLIIYQMNGLSHTVIEILVKRKRETLYKCRLGSEAMWVPESKLKLYEPDHKPEEKEDGDGTSNSTVKQDP